MTVWTSSLFEFLTFSDDLVFKPPYGTLSDSVVFSDTISVPIFQAIIHDGFDLTRDSFVVKGGSVHHVSLPDTLTLVDSMMRGGPQIMADYMVLVDEFDVAANLIVDGFVFSDTMIGVHATGLYDSVVFSDTFPALGFVWGSNTCDIVDQFGFADTFNVGQAYPQGQPVPNPWLPNFPTTQLRSGNPTCEQSEGQEGLPY